MGKIIVCFIPALVLSVIIVTNPITPENHSILANSLKENFGEDCYMSCGMLLSRSSIISQFVQNFKAVTFDGLIRFPLIILIGFGPIFLLSLNSKLKKEVLFFKYFNNLFYPILLLLTPVLFLFAMGGDWGRWVNISYTFTVLFYIYLLQNNLLEINLEKITKKNIFYSKQKILTCYMFYSVYLWMDSANFFKGRRIFFPGI